MEGHAEMPVGRWRGLHGSLEQFKSTLENPFQNLETMTKIDRMQMHFYNNLSNIPQRHLGNDILRKSNV